MVERFVMLSRTTAAALGRATPHTEREFLHEFNAQICQGQLRSCVS